MATGMARSCVHRTLNDETHSRYGRTGTWYGKSMQIILAPGHFTVTSPGTYPRVWQSVCSSGRMTSKSFQYQRRDTGSVASGPHGRPAHFHRSIAVYDLSWPGALEGDCMALAGGITLCWTCSIRDNKYKMAWRWYGVFRQLFLALAIDGHKTGLLRTSYFTGKR